MASLIVGNWKMYATSIADANILATSIRNYVSHFENTDIVLCPPAMWLIEIRNIIRKGSKISLGAQNVFYEKDGAYTGEISPLMLKDIADYVIVGHSERREYFGETNLDVNEKVIAVLKAGLKPIICVGEKKKNNSASQPYKELKEALEGVPKKYLKDIVVAYEPVWAIGTGENADPEYVARVLTKLRELESRNTMMLYGGSVKSKNIKGYAKRPEINGVLVGGASVRVSEFEKICRSFEEEKAVIFNED